MMVYQIAVVTKVPNPFQDPHGGNMAGALVYGLEADLAYVVLINGRIPVFTLGEILILDENQRDYGTTRKPDKWSVEIAFFDNLKDATECSQGITGD